MIEQCFNNMRKFP